MGYGRGPACRKLVTPLGKKGPKSVELQAFPFFRTFVSKVDDMNGEEMGRRGENGLYFDR